MRHSWARIWPETDDIQSPGTTFLPANQDTIPTSVLLGSCGSRWSGGVELRKTGIACKQRHETLAPNHVRVHLCLNELVEVKSWTLKFGGAAKVITPDELRESEMEELDEMQRNYQSSDL